MEVYYELSPDETADAPVTLEELHELLAQKQVNEETRCWAEGMDDWRALGQCVDLMPQKPATRAERQAATQGEQEPEDSLADALNQYDDDDGREPSFSEEFITSLSPVSTPGNYGTPSARSGHGTRGSPGSASSSSRYSSRSRYEARTSVLKGDGGVAAVSVENLLRRMESRMESVESAVSRADQATRDAAKLTKTVDHQERKLRENESEMAEMRMELGSLTQRVTDRVLKSIDLEALEHRIVRSDGDHEEKMLRLQSSVDAQLRKSEVGAAASLAKQRERSEAEQKLLVSDLEAASAKQMRDVEASVELVHSDLVSTQAIPTITRLHQGFSDRLHVVAGGVH